MAVEWEQDPLPASVDERWIPEFVDYGIRQLGNMLKNHAAFLEWCDSQEKKPDADD